MRVALVVPLALLAAACGGTQGARGSGPAKLLIEQTVDRSGPIPVEGAYSYVRIEDSSGGEVTEQRLPSDGRVSIQLDPGSYTLISYQRTCDANCGNLDPVSDTCSGGFTAAEDRSLSASIAVTYGSGCKILFTSMPSR